MGYILGYHGGRGRAVVAHEEIHHPRGARESRGIELRSRGSLFRREEQDCERSSRQGRERLRTEISFALDQKENNKRRLEVLKEQESIVATVVTNAGQQLKSLSQNDSSAYAQLMENLILQGLNKMSDEDAVRVHCLAAEVAMTQAATAKAKSRFEAKHNKSLDVQVDQAHPLPAVDQTTGEPCYGGIAISNMDHTIICQNTLNARLHIAAEATLPQMKSKLFPTMQQLMNELK